MHLIDLVLQVLRLAVIGGAALIAGKLADHFTSIVGVR